MERYLPIGSVVLLSGGEKRVMIFGRIQQTAEDQPVWDYAGFPYPEGNVGEEYTYLFNHDQIERIYFVGFQDEEEFDYQAKLQQLDLAQETA